MSNGGLPAQPDVHLTPDGGIQAYPHPYPAFRAPRGPHLGGREVVHLVATQGHWVQLTLDGQVVGWVDGRGLAPPVGGATMQPMPISPREAHFPVSTQPEPESQGLMVTVETVVGGIAALAIAIGALIDWTQGFVSVSSFKIPVEFLFDPKTTSRDPKLGLLLLLIGLVGLLASFFTAARPGRVLLGLLALAAAVLYCAQVAANIPDGAAISFTDVVGAGPWVTGIAGLVLALSPLARTNR